MTLHLIDRQGLIRYTLFVIIFHLTNSVSPKPQTHYHNNRQDQNVKTGSIDPEHETNFFEEIEVGTTPRSRNPLFERYERPRSIQSDSSTITFPHNLASPRSNTTVGLMTPNVLLQRGASDARRPKKATIPLKFLRGLSNEQDVSKIFEKYVTNVKLQDVNGQKYVVDLSGDPIDAGLGGPVRIYSEQPEKQKIKNFTGFSNRNIPKFPESAMSVAERVGATSRISKPAICEPELRTVEIPAPNDPSVIQFPRCVRLERCGGCCGSDLLSCEPIRFKQTEVQVQKFAYNDETEKLEYKETEVMILQSHLQCRCNCRVKSSDCSPRHIYNSEDCLCSCRNRGEQELCLQKQHKLWDATLCQCVCREIKVCSSGYMFNIDTCDCVPNPDGRRDDDEQNPRRNRREHGRIRFTRQQ